MDPNAWNEGVKLFDEGEYWHAHEALEVPWLKATGVEKHFLGGVILLAAALHKARAQGSARGGRLNYAKALRHLAVVPDSYYGIDVRSLEVRVHAALRDRALQPTVAGAAPQPPA